MIALANFFTGIYDVLMKWRMRQAEIEIRQYANLIPHSPKLKATYANARALPFVK